MTIGPCDDRLAAWPAMCYAFVTYDARQATAARELGLPVASPA